MLLNGHLMMSKVIIKIGSYYINQYEEDSIHLQRVCDNTPELIELEKEKILEEFRREAGYRKIAYFYHEPWEI